MMQRTPNSDRYAKQVALIRERESAKEPAPAPKAAAIKKQDPVPKADCLSVIAATVKLEGQVVISEAELVALAGLPEKDRSALNGFVRAAYARGLSYTVKAGEITFSAKELGSPTRGHSTVSQS